MPRDGAGPPVKPDPAKKKTRRGTRGKNIKGKLKANEEPDDATEDDEEDDDDGGGKPLALTHVDPKAKWGTFVPDGWSEATNELFAKALSAKGNEPKTGRIPCGFFYSGSCKRGDKCAFWHTK